MLCSKGISIRESVRLRFEPYRQVCVCSSSARPLLLYAECVPKTSLWPGLSNNAHHAVIYTGAIIFVCSCVFCAVMSLQIVELAFRFMAFFLFFGFSLFFLFLGNFFIFGLSLIFIFFVAVRHAQSRNGG